MKSSLLYLLMPIMVYGVRKDDCEGEAFKNLTSSRINDDFFFSFY